MNFLNWVSGHPNCLSAYKEFVSSLCNNLIEKNKNGHLHVFQFIDFNSTLIDIQFSMYLAVVSANLKISQTAH